MGLKGILEKVNARIKPTGEEIKKANAFLEVLNKAIKKSGYDAVPVIGGSLGKGTYIKGKFDCDIFVRFSKKYPDSRISDYLGMIIAPICKAQRIHGSRDYFNLKYKGIDYELVPVLRIEKVSDAKNITDTSPLHVDWVLGKFKNNEKLKDEIRLSKMFFKANNMYGSESYINGFSGHVLDILTIYYGGFVNLLKSSLEWKKGNVIDIEDYYASSDPKEILNNSKLQSPLIVIDPIQKVRNAAAALDYNKYMGLKAVAKEFLKKPQLKYFKEQVLSIAKIKRSHTENTIILKGVPQKGNHDVIGCRILKVYNYLRKTLAGNGFVVLDSGWYWKKGPFFLMWFNMENMIIDNEFVKMGPPVKKACDYKKFTQKHVQTYVENGRVYARARREYNNALSLMSFLLSSKYVVEKVDKIRIV